MADRLPFLLLVAWIVAAPVFLGSVPEAVPAEGPIGTFIGAGGGYALYVLLGAAAAVALLPGLLGRRGTALAPDRGSRWMVRCLAFLPLLGLAQLVPLPRAVHGILAPAHLADLDVLVPGAGWAPISTDPGLTLRSVVFLALLLFAGLVVLSACRGAKRAWTVAGALVAVATAGAVYGLLESYLFGNRVLSHQKGPDPGVTGTFFLRNNFVAFSVAGLGAAAAGLIEAFRRGRPLLASGAAMSTAILTAGVALSGSRAGIAAAFLATLFGCALAARTWRGRILMAALVTSIYSAGYFTQSSLRERVEFFSESAESEFLDIRVPIWTSTLDLAGTRPLLGCGLGTYRGAIYLTKSPLVAKDPVYAHSDPLNLLAEGGAVGLLLGGGLFLIGIVGAMRGTGRRGGETRGLSAACAGGLAGMLAMAAVDFPLQIPATSLACAVLLFLPAAARAPVPGPVRTAGRSWALVAVVVVAAGILSVQQVAGSWGKPRYLTRGEELSRTGEHLSKGDDWKEARCPLTEAAELQPFDGRTRYLLAEARYRADGEGAGTFLHELNATHRVARGHEVLLLKIGWLAYRTRQRELAVQAFREAGTIHVDRFIEVFQKLKDDDMEMALAIVPEVGIAHRHVAEHYRAKEEREEAIAAYWRAVQLGVNGRVCRLMAGLYRELGREKEGRKLYADRGIPWPGE